MKFDVQIKDGNHHLIASRMVHGVPQPSGDLDTGVSAASDLSEVGAVLRKVAVFATSMRANDVEGTRATAAT